MISFSLSLSLLNLACLLPHPFLSISHSIFKPLSFLRIEKTKLHLESLRRKLSRDISHTPIKTTMSNNSRPKNTTHACAACKYQRKKCAPDCVLAPYFPHHRQRQFLNAHKLFGVKKITKTIENLDDPSKKDQAMRTIVYQSDVRANDPVGGCYRIICELKHQIEYNMVELELVLQQLALCRAPVPVSHQAYAELSPNCHDVIKPRTGVEINDPMSYDHPHLRQRHEEEEYLLHEPSLQDVVSWGVQDAAVSSSLHDKQSFVNECHNFKPNGLDDGGERFEIQFDYEHGEERIEGERFAPLPLRPRFS